MQVSGLRMNQNRFDACPALAVLPSQHRYEDSGEGGNRFSSLHLWHFITQKFRIPRFLCVDGLWCIDNLDAMSRAAQLARERAAAQRAADI